MPANLNLEYNRSSTSLVTAGLLRQTCKKTDSIDHCYLGKPRKQWREVSARARRSWWRGGNRGGRWRSPGRSCDLAATLCPSTWSVSLLRTSHFDQSCVLSSTFTFQNEKYKSLSLSTSIGCRQRRRQGRWTSLQLTAPASPTEKKGSQDCVSI